MRPFIQRYFVEHEKCSGAPVINGGGKLEPKHGQICLRCPDSLVAISHHRFRITRTWHRPGKKPFDQQLYDLA